MMTDDLLFRRRRREEFGWVGKEFFGAFLQLDVLFLGPPLSNLGILGNCFPDFGKGSRLVDDFQYLWALGLQCNVFDQVGRMKISQAQLRSRRMKKGQRSLG